MLVDDAELFSACDAFAVWWKGFSTVANGSKLGSVKETSFSDKLMALSPAVVVEAAAIYGGKMFRLGGIGGCFADFWLALGLDWDGGEKV